jgi:hypothetical protein
LKSSKAFDLNAKGQIAQLRIGEEDDEEHYREAGDIFGTLGQCFTQLCHRLVETDVFEDLQEEKNHRRERERVKNDHRQTLIQARKMVALRTTLN